MIPKPKSRPLKPKAVVRLKGAAMEALRRKCFERDGYRCQHMILGKEKCGRPVIWERGSIHSGHMAHIRARSLGGPDTLENVKLKCMDCHIRREHGMGEK